MQEKAAPDGTVEVACTVKNSGSRDGEEVVQLYVTDELACMIRPVQELAGFYRVFLRAGESKRVSFRMKTDQFAFLDQKMGWLVEAGEMTVKIGSSSRDIRLTGMFKITSSMYVEGKPGDFMQKHGKGILHESEDRKNPKTRREIYIPFLHAIYN